LKEEKTKGDRGRVDDDFKEFLAAFASFRVRYSEQRFKFPSLKCLK